MRIATWNVNSIRSRRDRVLAWLEAHQPDMLCLQETKVADEDFPARSLAERGYRVATWGQRAYNGVAIVAREEPRDVVRGLDDGEGDDEPARLIAGTVGGVRVVSAYFPNGKSPDSDKYAYKKRWIERLLSWLDRNHRPDDPLALCGDFNIAADVRDVHDAEKWEGTVLFNDEMRAYFRALCDWGLVDVLRLHHEEPGVYTWWDYRMLAFPKNRGLRIDYVMTTRPLAERCTGAYVDRDQRKKTTCPDGSTPSDHVPVVADLDWDA